MTVQASEGASAVASAAARLAGGADPRALLLQEREALSAFEPARAPISWSRTRDFLVLDGVAWLAATPTAPPRGHALTTELGALETRGLVLAEESLGELTDDERAHLVDQRVFGGVVEALGTFADDLARGGEVTEVKLGSFLRHWASAEEAWLLATRTSTAESPHGSSVHLFWSRPWTGGDAEPDPFAASRRVASFPLEHHDASSHPVLDAARVIAACAQQLARARWSVETVVLEAAAVGGLSAEGILTSSGKRDQRLIESVREQLKEALRRADLEDLLDRFDGTVGSKEGAADEVAMARRLLASASVWGRVRLHQEHADDRMRWCRPLIQVHEPMHRIGDVEGVPVGRRSVITAPHPLLVRGIFVLADAWSIEERRAHVRSWDDGRSWHEPLSADWTPKGRSGRLTMGAEVPVFSLCGHGPGTPGALDGLDLLYPEEFLNLRMLLLGPTAST